VTFVVKGSWFSALERIFQFTNCSPLSQGGNRSESVGFLAAAKTVSLLEIISEQLLAAELRRD
jgi:hypothetical protein